MIMIMKILYNKLNKMIKWLWNYILFCFISIVAISSEAAVTFTVSEIGTGKRKSERNASYSSRVIFWNFNSTWKIWKYIFSTAAQVVPLNQTMYGHKYLIDFQHFHSYFLYSIFIHTYTNVWKMYIASTSPYVHRVHSYVHMYANTIVKWSAS